MTKRLNKKKIIICALIIAIIFAIINNSNTQKTIQKKIYPKKYSNIIEKYAKEYDVEENLIYAIIKVESNFNEKAVSKKNAIGLMQLMYSTAVDISDLSDTKVTEEQLLNPDTNIKLGTKNIAILINKYENFGLALAAYNAGSGNVDSWISEGIIQSDGSNIEKIPFKETNNYVRKILRDYKIYCEM